MVVATVERGLRETFFWLMAMAGESPSMRSTGAFSSRPEELSRIGGERLDEAALPFREDRVECERGLAAPEGPVTTVMLPVGIAHVDRLQVVRARAPRSSVRPSDAHVLRGLALRRRSSLRGSRQVGAAATSAGVRFLVVQQPVEGALE